MLCSGLFLSLDSFCCSRCPRRLPAAPRRKSSSLRHQEPTLANTQALLSPPAATYHVFKKGKKLTSHWTRRREKEAQKLTVWLGT